MSILGLTYKAFKKLPKEKQDLAHLVDSNSDMWYDYPDKANISHTAEFPDMNVAMNPEQYNSIRNPDMIGRDATAAHTLRGEEGFIHNPGVEFDEDDMERLNATGLYNYLVKEGHDSSKVLDIMNKRFDMFDVINNRGRKGGADQNWIERMIEESKVKSPHDAYVLRDPGLYSKDKQHIADYIYSGRVVDPADKSSYLPKSKQGINNTTNIYKLRKGDQFYHPAGTADNNEILMKGNLFNKMDNMLAKDYFRELVFKGKAPFSVGGAGVMTGLTAGMNPERADADVGSITGEYEMGSKEEPNMTMLEFAEKLRGANRRLGIFGNLTPLEGGANLLEKHAFKAPRGIMDYIEALP